MSTITEKYGTLMRLVGARCCDGIEVGTVEKAFDFAYDAHKDAVRRNGEPYILHPLEVATIVVSDMDLGYKSICAALLHDIPGSTRYTSEDIKALFGENICSLVEGLSMIKAILDDSLIKDKKAALLASGVDQRVFLIKLADRLQNCRNLASMSEAKRRKILGEAMSIFIPLAHRLGLYGIKSEMEDIWLSYEDPVSYREISGLISESSAKHKDSIDEFIAPIAGILRRDDFTFKIKTRIKSPYSVWRKMKKKNIPFDEIYDLYAVRIIYESTSNDPEIERRQAYMIFSDITTLFKEKPSRHRDWIHTPKENGYEALHGTFMSLAGIWVEVQVRSTRMDDIAEKGIAAHWSYKRAGLIPENK